MQKVAVLLFDGFETLDAFGPVELLGRLSEHYEIAFYSTNGCVVESSQKVRVETRLLDNMETGSILLIPGGMGTRKLVEDDAFIKTLAAAAHKAEYILCVCTGSALLAKTGLLKNREATSNKRAFAWVASLDPAVKWRRQARWVVDGHIYTSSGVSAGMDMALGFVADTKGRALAEESARGAEYVWHEDKHDDPFA